VKTGIPQSFEKSWIPGRAGNRRCAWNDGSASQAKMRERNSAAALAVRRDSCYDAGQIALKHFHKEEIA
jgi:hypothetical protein